MSKLFSLGKLHVSGFVRDSENPRSEPAELQLILDANGAVRLDHVVDKNEMYGKYWYSWGAPREMLHEDCLQFLNDNKFVILCEHNMRESASHDGLIVAKNPRIDPDFNVIEISKLTW